MTLSPKANPEIEMIRFGSKVVPVTVMCDKVYCFGFFALKIFSSSTFTELGTLSLAAGIESFFAEICGTVSFSKESVDTESLATWAKQTVRAVKEKATKSTIL